jgi:hypothetical protein
MFITVVEDIVKTDFVTIIILRPYDASGYFLPVNKIMLDEIISLYPFRSQFANPFLEQTKRDEGIERLKNLIR